MSAQSSSGCCLYDVCGRTVCRSASPRSLSATSAPSSQSRQSWTSRQCQMIQPRVFLLFLCSHRALTLPLPSSPCLRPTIWPPGSFHSHWVKDKPLLLQSKHYFYIAKVVSKSMCRFYFICIDGVQMDIINSFIVCSLHYNNYRLGLTAINLYKVSNLFSC